MAVSTITPQNDNSPVAITAAMTLGGILTLLSVMFSQPPQCIAVLVQPL